jgi:hypothetical protein
MLYTGLNRALKVNELAICNGFRQLSRSKSDLKMLISTKNNGLYTKDQIGALTYTYATLLFIGQAP